MQTKSYISKITDLLSRAIEAKLSLEDLKKEWPIIELKSNVFEMLYEDLEEAVIHVPLFVFTRKIDYKIWESFLEYKVLICDFHLMPYVEDVELWKDLRERLINGRDDWSFESIKIDLEKRLKVV